MCDYGENQPNGAFSEGCIAADAMGVTLLDDGMLMISFPSGRKGSYEMETRTGGSWIRGKLIAIDGEPVTYVPGPPGTWGEGKMIPTTPELIEQQRQRDAAAKQAALDKANADLARQRAQHGPEVEVVEIDTITKRDRIVRIGSERVIEVYSIRTVSNRYRSLRDAWGSQYRIDLGTLVYRLP